MKLGRAVTVRVIVQGRLMFLSWEGAEGGGGGSGQGSGLVTLVGYFSPLSFRTGGSERLGGSGLGGSFLSFGITIKPRWVLVIHASHELRGKPVS